MDQYLALDDTIILGALPLFQNAENRLISKLAKCLSERALYKTLGLEAISDDKGKKRGIEKKIDKMMRGGQFNGDVVKDDQANAGIYSSVFGEEERIHKKVQIVFKDGMPKEITSVSKLIETVERDKKPLIRYYFENESDKQLALKGR